MAPAPEFWRYSTSLYCLEKPHHLHVVTTFAYTSETVDFNLIVSLSSSSALLLHDGQRLQMLPALGSIIPLRVGVC